MRQAAVYRQPQRSLAKGGQADLAVASVLRHICIGYLRANGEDVR
jgi:hypothetical protein